MGRFCKSNLYMNKVVAIPYSTFVTNIKKHKGFFFVATSQLTHLSANG